MNKKFSKKAISMLVAYSLLIGISVAMAGSVYIWLKYYVSSPLTTESCPSETSIIISDYCCSEECGMGNRQLNLTVQNHGYFNISGYIIKMNKVDPSGKAIAGRYNLCAGAADPCADGDNFFSAGPLPPTFYNSTVFNYSKTDYNEIRVIQIEPYRIVSTSKTGKLERVLCDKAIVTQKISCS